MRLTYTGIDKHADDEVGGWDTTIRRTQYEKLFYNQQSSMTSIDKNAYASVSEPSSRKIENKTEAPVIKHREEKSSFPTTKVRMDEVHQQLQEKDMDKFTALSEGSIVHHKKFGEGRVVKIINNEKFIHVKFTIGEKKFVYPDAFMMGFLEVK
jgi:hypothetical protein